MGILIVHVVYEVSSVGSWLVLFFQELPQDSTRYLFVYVRVHCGRQNSENDPNGSLPLVITSSLFEYGWDL